MASYVIDWQELVNVYGQCPLSFLCNTIKTNREVDAIDTRNSALKTEYATYCEYKSDYEPLLEIAKLVTPELNLQLIDGWLPPRMTQVFMHVAELYYDYFKSDVDSMDFDEDSNIPIEDIIILTGPEYWPSKVMSEGSMVSKMFLLGWLCIFEAIKKLIQNSIAPTKSNIIKELDLSDYVIIVITGIEDGKNMETIVSNEMFLCSLPPHIIDLIKSKSNVLRDLMIKVNDDFQLHMSTINDHEKCILRYYTAGGSIDHVINFIIDNARCCYEKKYCEGIFYDPFLDELIPIIKNDQEMKILPETKLDFQWFVIYYVIFH